MKLTNGVTNRPNANSSQAELTDTWIGDEKERDSGDEPIQLHGLIGHFGKYQFLIFMFKILIGVTSAFNNLGVTFYAPTDYVGFQCAEDIASFDISPLNSNSTKQFVHHNSLNIVGDNFKSNDRSLFVTLSDIINSYDHRHNNFSEISLKKPKSLTKKCHYQSENGKQKCRSYQYDKGIWLSTIIDEWDLVCDRAWLVSLTQSVYMSGFIVSFLVFGYISDSFGRWRSMMIGALIEISCGLGCAFSNSITAFLIFRFLLGLGTAGRTTSAYLVMIEWCGPKWRMHVSTLGSVGWTVGYCLMPWITLYFTHFRHMQLFVCFYESIYVIWMLRLPESPRWLLTHKRFEEAYRVLLMAAKFNGLVKSNKGSKDSLREYSKPNPFSRNLTTNGSGNRSPIHFSELGSNLQEQEGNFPLKRHNTTTATTTTMTVEQFDKKFEALRDSILTKEFSKDEDRLCLLDLFKWKNLRRYTLILSFVWAVNSFIYYGIVLGVGDFGAENLFLAFTIAGIAELPSIAFTIVCMKFLPRKSTNLFIFTTTGFLCGLQIPLRYYGIQWLQQGTMMMAKLFNSIAFSCVLYQTMELFPTSIRQNAYCACFLAARIGSILAPFIKTLQQMTTNEIAPALYVVLSILTSLMILGLPETKGADLHDTLMEAEKFEGKNKK